MRKEINMFTTSEPEELNAFGDGEWEVIDMAVDSGATETVINEKMVSGELKIVVDKSETLFVVDVLKFNENGKIIAIHAYLGRDD